MNEFFRSVRSVAQAVAAASLLASCDDNTNVLDAFFWGRGAGDCERLTVTIELDQADARLAPGRKGEQECSLHYILENNGCEIDVDHVGSERVRVVIHDCRIGDTSGLFRCGFSEGDLLAISDATTAICDCFGERCDESPPVCVNDDPDRGSCEACDNGLDDDGDGLADCEDDACENECGVSTTTSTSTTNSHESSTSTTTTTTTSTTLSEPPSTTTTTDVTPTSIYHDLPTTYYLTFQLDSASANVAALQWSTDYSPARGNFAGVGAMAGCRNLVPSSLFAQYNRYLVCSGDDHRVCWTNTDCLGLGDCSVTFKELALGVISLDSFSAPIDLVECEFDGWSRDEPSPSDFSVTIEDATDAAGDSISASISVSVSYQSSQQSAGTE